MEIYPTRFFKKLLFEWGKPTRFGFFGFSRGHPHLSSAFFSAHGSEFVSAHDFEFGSEFFSQITAKIIAT